MPSRSDRQYPLPEERFQRDAQPVPAIVVPVGARKRRKYDPVDRRSRILDVSARLFAEYGFEQTSVRQIADQVQILPGSLYHHFETKENILHEIIREPQQRMLKQQEALARLPANAELRLIATTISRFRQSPATWYVNLILAQESKFFRQREEFAYVRDAKSRASLAVEALLREGIESGLFRRDIDTYLTMVTIWGIVSSAVARLRASQLVSRQTSEPYGFDEVVDYHLDCVLRLLRPASRIDDPIPRQAGEEMAESCMGAI
jgi:TetR/AcrR family transcriptional regulator, cholesterol catabolism regulator